MKAEQRKPFDIVARSRALPGNAPYPRLCLVVRDVQYGGAVGASKPVGSQGEPGDQY